MSFQEDQRPRRTAQHSSSKSNDGSVQLVLLILIVIIAILVIAALIWWLMSNRNNRNHHHNDGDHHNYGDHHNGYGDHHNGYGDHHNGYGDHKHKHDHCDCSQLDAVMNLEICPEECPRNSWKVWWSPVDNADCYVLTFVWMDLDNQTQGQQQIETRKTMTMFKLSEQQYSNNIHVSVSVYARNKKCMINSPVSQVESDSYQPKWHFSSTYETLAPSEGWVIRDMNKQPLIAGSQDFDYFDYYVSHHFTGETGQPHDFELLAGTGGTDGTCQLVIEEVPLDELNAGAPYTNANVIYQQMTPSFNEGEFKILTGKVTPTLEDSVWVYTCETDEGGAMLYPKTLRVTEQ